MGRWSATICVVGTLACSPRREAPAGGSAATPTPAPASPDAAAADAPPAHGSPADASPPTDAGPTAVIDAALIDAPPAPPMDWTGLPKRCGTLDDELWDHHELHRVKRVAGYAWIADGKVTIQIADHPLYPTGTFADPSGEQRLATLIVRAKLGRHRGTDDTLVVSYEHGDRAWNPWSVDNYVITISHLDQTWVCGALEVPVDKGKPVPQRFAARIVTR